MRDEDFTFTRTLRFGREKKGKAIRARKGESSV